MSEKQDSNTVLVAGMKEISLRLATLATAQDDALKAIREQIARMTGAGVVIKAIREQLKSALVETGVSANEKSASVWICEHREALGLTAIRKSGGGKKPWKASKGLRAALDEIRQKINTALGIKIPDSNKELFDVCKRWGVIEG